MFGSAVPPPSEREACRLRAGRGLSVGRDDSARRPRRAGCPRGTARRGRRALHLTSPPQRASLLLKGGAPVRKLGRRIAFWRSQNMRSKRGPHKPCLLRMFGFAERNPQSAPFKRSQAACGRGRRVTPSVSFADSSLGEGALSPAGGTPSQSALRLTAPPKGELGERFWKDPYLPLWGRWHGEAVTERALRGSTTKKWRKHDESHNQLQSLPI